MHYSQRSSYKMLGTCDKWINKRRHIEWNFIQARGRNYDFGGRVNGNRIMLGETSQSQEKRHHAHFLSKEEGKTMKTKGGGCFLRKVGRKTWGGGQKDNTGMNMIKIIICTYGNVTAHLFISNNEYPLIIK